MAKPDTQDFVDISSSSDVKKIYGKNDPRAPRKSKKGVVLRVLVLLLSLVLLLGGTGLVYYYSVLDSMHFKELDNLPQPTVSNTMESTSVSVTPGGATPLSSDNVLNILLFGQDTAASAEDYGRSDTTILLSIDNVNKKPCSLDMS